MKNIYVKIRKCSNVFSAITNVLLVLMLLVLVANMVTVHMEDNHDILGYQPVYIKTGSMEPTIREDAIILTQRVSSLDQLEVGDIITYKVWDETGRELHITHRIYNIIDGRIITKGDNNRVTDSYELTMDNVTAKVVVICNKAADIIHATQSRQGLLFLASCVGFITCLCIAWSTLIAYLDEKYEVKKIEKTETVKEKEEG